MDILSSGDKLLVIYKKSCEEYNTLVADILFLLDMEEDNIPEDIRHGILKILDNSLKRNHNLPHNREN